MKNVIAQGALALGAALLTALTPAPVQAQSLTEVTFGVLSPTAAEWPVYLANTQGFFKEEGLTVTIVQGNTPTNVLSEVATGAVNLADNGTDTEIAAIAHGLPLKLIAPMFGVNPYSVVTLPTIKTWSDLNGKSVMTGTKQDVTAMVLDSLAKAHGLKGGLGDFSIVIGGNSTARYAGLVSGNVQGALLSQPYDLLAESKGMTILGTASEVMKDWVFTSIIANDDWASKNRPTVVKFLRALRKGVLYGYMHKADAVAALVAQIQIDPAIAAKAWDLDFGKWHAFDRNLTLAPASLALIGKYLQTFGTLSSAPRPADVYDGSYVAEAVR
jgi:NitT/TauT family transport system substrate-binding protein